MNSSTPNTPNSGMQQGAQMRITEDEMRLIRATFRGNDNLLRLMRKMFLPELDPTAPIGQMIDLWMTIDVKDMTPEMALINIKSRNALIMHVDQQLMSLALIAKTEPLTPDEAVAKVKANSTK